MAGPYIPPHKRGPSGSSSLGNPEVEAERKPEDGYTLNEISNQYFHDHQRLYTLNRASETAADGTPTLGFVLVFKDQQPQWPPTICCKTNLVLLAETDTLSSAQIAVFEELIERDTKEHERKFVYVGAHTITRIEDLEPRTPPLVKMLESKIKGPGSQRFGMAWDESVSIKWAIVDLKKVEGGEEEQSNPMEPLKEIKEKGSTERLEEMRLRASGPAKENEKPSAADESEEVPKSKDP